MMTTFAVVIPVYNRAHCIGEAIDSVLAQTKLPHEIIVVDDGSTDDLSHALAPYRTQITLIRQANNGVSAARNAGILHANSDWVTFLDSDDVWEPQRIQILAHDLQAHPDIECHIANALFEYRDGDRTLFDVQGISGQQRPLAQVISGMTTQCAAIKRATLVELGGFDTSMTYFEDTELFCRLALRAGFALNPQVVATIRRVPSQTQALCDIETQTPAKAIEAQIYCLTKLLPLIRNSIDRDIVTRKLSGAYFQMSALCTGRARNRFLWQAANTHPNRLKGWLKSGVARISGERIFLRHRKRHVRPVRT